MHGCMHELLCCSLTCIGPLTIFVCFILAIRLLCTVFSGIDTDHPDFEGRAIFGIDFVDNPSPRNDPNGHGTHVAGYENSCLSPKFIPWFVRFLHLQHIRPVYIFVLHVLPPLNNKLKDGNNPPSKY